MPKRRSATARAVSSSSASPCFRASKTTKSLPRPCIFRNGVMGGYIGTTLLHRQRNTGVFRPLILRGNSMRFRIIGPAVLVAAALTGMVAMAEDVDSYLWLEDVHGAKP